MLFDDVGSPKRFASVQAWFAFDKSIPTVPSHLLLLHVPRNMLREDSSPPDFPMEWSGVWVGFHNSRLWMHRQSLRLHSLVERWARAVLCKTLGSADLPLSRDVFWEKQLYCVFWMRENCMHMNEPGHRGNVNSQVITGLYFLSVNREEGRIRYMLFFCFPVSWSQKREFPPLSVIWEICFHCGCC